MKPSHQLEIWLSARAGRRDAAALQPFPATRQLGEQFGVSHATAFRLLCRMEQAGKVWRHPNGRFYPAVAGRVLGQPPPLAVMLRKMEAWSSLCREVMEGFTERCSEADRTLILCHSRALVNQTEAAGPFSIAGEEVQQEWLNDQALRYGGSVGGVLVDECFRDEVLEKTLPPELPQVVFFRKSRAEGNVAADFRAGAREAFSYLQERRYDAVHLIDLSPDHLSSRQFLTAARTLHPRVPVIPLMTPEDETALLDRLKQRTPRTALIFPEDNRAVAFVERMEAHGMKPGKDHGVLSVMGAASPTRLTAVHYDFRAMGRTAAEMLLSGKCRRTTLPPHLCPGATA